MSSSYDPSIPDLDEISRDISEAAEIENRITESAAEEQRQVQNYTATREDLDEAANKLFEMVKSQKVKIDIFKKYSLKESIVAHKDLENRKIIGPAIIVPN